MKFSICMPVFNREKLVTRAIRSCLAQTGDDFEIVVTDDGSTDGTVDVIEQIGDNRIIRPLSVYSGPAARQYAPLATRG